MIPTSAQRLETDRWQKELAQAITRPAELLAILGLGPEAFDGQVQNDPDFPLRVPRYFVDLMRRGDPHDPLLRQVLPLSVEQTLVPGYLSDPVGDLPASHHNGLLQKYKGRTLLISTGACAVHCRYCFRRHFPYQEQSVLKHWGEAMRDLGSMSDCEELILSGGDPLSLSDARLEQLLAEAEDIEGLRRLRIHTRLPVVLPDRITPKLATLLSKSRLRTIMVIHANHPNEVTPALGKALQPLTSSGTTLLNQSVLLKSVNDDAVILSGLSEALFEIGVLPYYLHLLDPVAGAAHFDVSLTQARRLLTALRGRLPGYLVPRVVKEVQGEPAKTPIDGL